jgi:hypothetical protein
MNELRNGTLYSDPAFSALKKYMLNIYPFVSRHINESEKKRLGDLMTIPAHLGGLGYEG